jgi:hypothetical protein
MTGNRNMKFERRYRAVLHRTMALWQTAGCLKGIWRVETEHEGQCKNSSQPTPEAYKTWQWIIGKQRQLLSNVCPHQRQLNSGEISNSILAAGSSLVPNKAMNVDVYVKLPAGPLTMM